MAKYIFGILACAFLALGFTHISNKELQGFQKETGVPAIDMSYNEGANCCICNSTDIELVEYDASGETSEPYLL